jgi:tetratricopeptide (TPR) repeat protein
MVFARTLLPAPEGFVIVWVMFPMQIASRAAYAALMRDVLKHEFPFPWCHHMRILLREDPADPELARTLGKPPRIAWYEPDLSPRAFEKALDEEIDDKALPLEQRLQAVLVSAGIDYSHKRYEQALGKYQLLLRYYMGKSNHALSALVLNSIGEISLAQGKQKEAGECWEAAVIPATQGDPPALPILVNVVWNLATLRMSEKKWPEAEGYFNEAQKLATLQRNAPFKVVALEHLGQAQYEQGKIPEALETWNAGLTVAEKLELPRERKAVLERLRKHYAGTRDQGKLREIERQLAAAPAGGADPAKTGAR